MNEPTYITIESQEGTKVPSELSVIATTTLHVASGRIFVRHEVPHPGGSAVVALDGDRAICVQQYRPAIRRTTVELPGGRPSEGEAPLETARRELLEETGYSASAYTLLARCHAAPDFSDWVVHIYLATGIVRNGLPTGNPATEMPTSLCSIRLDDLESLIAAETLIDAKTIIGLMLARSVLETRKVEDSLDDRAWAEAAPS